MVRQQWQLITWIAFIDIATAHITIIDLRAEDWQLHLSDELGRDQVIPAQVPGDQYTAAMAAKWIDDPYIGNNDVKYRWLGDSNITFECQFKMPPLLPDSSVVFYQSGVDTVATTSLNGIDILYNSNMWLTQSTLVNQQIKSGANTIKLNFMPPQIYGEKKANEYKATYGYGVGPDQVQYQQNGLSHPNFLRKMQSAFSWDWGPGFPTMGIQGEVKVVVIEKSSCYNQMMAANVKVQDANWLVEVYMEVRCANDVKSFDVIIAIDEIDSSLRTTAQNTGEVNKVRQYLKVSKSKVEMWWPIDYGDQRLYSITSGVFAAEQITISKKTQSIGFRSVKKIEKPVPGHEQSAGLTFYFEINDVPVFLKGSNWIPSDSFLSKITDDRLEYYFASMAAVHMNAIRVWGGGTYERDEFYSFADKYGILIWHDFMFAVALYPTDNEFLNSVTLEVEQQSYRLSSHPCVFVWAGNNENELGLLGGWYHTDKQGTQQQYKNDYMKLNNNTIWGKLNQTDTSRPYLLSSPSNGMQSIKEGGMAFDANSYVYGDVHYYNYGSQVWDPNDLPITRCTTEFGFQSLPSLETMDQVLKHDEYLFTGEPLKHRQHHPLGNNEFNVLISYHFKYPLCAENKEAKKPKQPSWAYARSSECDPKNITQMRGYYDRMSYLSQIHQARGYEAQIKHYRSYRNRTTEQGAGYTMCALYWQLNDIWQAPTWSSIDYNRKWKMSHYMGYFYHAPLAIQTRLNPEGRLVVTILNDLQVPITKASLLIQEYRFKSGFDAIKNYTYTIQDVPALTSVKVFTESTNEGTIRKTTQDYAISVDLMHNLQNVSVFQSVLLPTEFFQIQTNDYGHVWITDVQEIEPGRVYQVSIKANGIAPYVWLDVKNVTGWFSKNAFTLTRPTDSVNFYVWQSRDKMNTGAPVTLDRFKAALSVASLADVYSKIG